MSALRPAPATIAGQYLQLEPLTRVLLPELHRAIAQPAVFSVGSGRGPAVLHPALGDFIAWASASYQSSGLPSAVRPSGGPHDAALAGSDVLGWIEREATRPK